MKKKILISVLAVIMIVSCVACFAACNKNEKGTYTALQAQANIFTELNAKTADVGVMDYTMANYLLKTESSLANNLIIVDGIDFEKEYYGIAFRKAGSGKDYNYLCDVVNEALIALKDTDYATIAEKYNVNGNKVDLAYTASYAKKSGTADMTDLNKVTAANKIIIGYTLNAPMALGSGDQVTGGFDTELAEKVIDYINAQSGTSIAIEWRLIEWGNKEAEMEAGTIDCVWNGLTITDSRSAMWDISIPYLENKQCVVIRKADKEKYTTVDSLKTARLVAEDGSAGEDVIKELLGLE